MMKMSTLLVMSTKKMDKDEVFGVCFDVMNGSSLLMTCELIPAHVYECELYSQFTG